MNQPQDLLPEQENTYRTGATAPPKSRRGIMAALLVIIILLLGLITLLSVTNIRLFQQLSSTGETLGISALSNATHATQPQTVQPTEEAVRIGDDAALPQAEALPLAEETASALVTVSCADCSTGTVGAGILVSEEGYVVTTGQVVAQAQSIQVHLSDNRVLAATLVGTDTVTGLAVLQVSAPGLPAAQFIDAGALAEGDPVYALSDSPKSEQAFGACSITGLHSAADGTPEFILLSVPLEEHYSFRPLLDQSGRTVGITLPQSDGQNGIALSSNAAISVVNRLIREQQNQRGISYGITGEDVPAFYQVYYELPFGMHIIEVLEGSLAHRSGLRPGDIILSVNGIRVGGALDCRELLLQHAAEPVVSLVVFRNGSRLSLNLLNGE